MYLCKSMQCDITDYQMCVRRRRSPANPNTAAALVSTGIPIQLLLQRQVTSVMHAVVRHVQGWVGGCMGGYS